MAQAASRVLALSLSALLLAQLPGCFALPLPDAPHTDHLACTPYSGTGLCAPYGQGFRFGVNNRGGSGLVSRQHYLSGHFSLTLRLPRVSSAGVNFGFYLMDSVTQRLEDPRHTEIDFEFVGHANSTQVTAVLSAISGGMQNVARVRLPFDPSAKFHTYSIRWNARQIVWVVDNSPIRILDRTPGRPWPTRAMSPQVAAWNAPWTGARNAFASGPVTGIVGGFRALGCATLATAVSTRAVECQGPWNLAMKPEHQTLAAKFASSFQIANHGWVDLA